MEEWSRGWGFKVSIFPFVVGVPSPKLVTREFGFRVRTETTVTEGERTRPGGVVSGQKQTEGGHDVRR